MIEKSVRHIRIREIISSEQIETQDELIKRLNEYGLNVTQTTISRDIKGLQSIKVSASSEQYVYNLPNDRKYHPLEKLGRYLMGLFVNIEGAGSLLVLRTPPGNAQSIGAILDQIDWDEVLGTICGDDTCLLICRDEEASYTIRTRTFNLLQGCD